MKCLFYSENKMFTKICNVIQLLLTKVFEAAKYFWYAEICDILPDDSDNLDGVRIDKQVVMYHITSVYRRNYDYTCSSDNCPSQMGAFQLSTDAADDMILHQSITLGKNENIMEKSIKLWELGTAPQAEFSCNKSFETEPDHPYYINYDDHGKTYLKCSGWRKPKNLAFNDTQPFLVFDISSTFRAEIKSLDTLPHQITIYGQIYRLGDITSFVDNRSHYVAYIQYSNSFFHYDCLPSNNQNSRYKLTCLSMEMFFYYAISHAILYLSNLIQDTN